MPDLLFEQPPAEYDPAYFRRQFERLQRGIPPTLTYIGPQRLELNADTGFVPIHRADWPLVVRRVEIWSPITVEPSAELYTVLDVRNKDKNVSLLAAAGGFSTSGGLKQWEWKTVAAQDDEDEASGPDMSMERHETLWVTWDHFATGVALSSLPHSLDSEQGTEADMPAETGGLLVEVWIRVTVERS